MELSIDQKNVKLRTAAYMCISSHHIIMNTNNIFFETYVF